jgi:hypothetical protein
METKMSTQKNPKIETVSSTDSPNGDIDREELLNAIGGAARQPEAPKVGPTPEERFANFGSNRQSESRNQFDNMESLRARQDFVGQVGVKKILATVPVRRPGPQDFFRVRPEREYRFDFHCIELKDDNEMYIVDPSMVPDLASELTLRTFYTGMTRQNVLFLWPAKTPNPDGGLGIEWQLSAMYAAELAMKKWVRIKGNRSLGAYEITEAADNFPEPEWPEYSFNEICEVAYRNRPIIRSFDHEVVKRLRGQI